MRWILDHWDKEYISMAEKEIKRTVSLLLQLGLRDVLSNLPQDA